VQSPLSRIVDSFDHRERSAVVLGNHRDDSTVQNPHRRSSTGRCTFTILDISNYFSLGSTENNLLIGNSGSPSGPSGILRTFLPTCHWEWSADSLPMSVSMGSPVGTLAITRRCASAPIEPDGFRAGDTLKSRRREDRFVYPLTPYLAHPSIDL
jgi:hypothetical protein